MNIEWRICKCRLTLSPRLPLTLSPRRSLGVKCVQHFRIAVLCLAILFAASFASGEPEDAVQTQRAGSATHQTPSEGVLEELTQAYLKEISPA